jgi:hypothetical protein
MQRPQPPTTKTHTKMHKSPTPETGREEAVNNTLLPCHQPAATQPSGPYPTSVKNGPVPIFPIVGFTDIKFTQK